MSNLVLTERDRVLLETLYSFGLMNTGQIERKVFGGIRKATVLRRLRKLHKKRLIARISATDKGALVWWITPKGSGLIGDHRGYGRLNRNTIEHDLALSEIRIALENVGVIQAWNGSHLLRRREVPQRKRDAFLGIPDAIAVMPMGDRVWAVAIELELSVKSVRRYERVLFQYQKKNSLALVWYIVPNNQIASVVMKAMRSNAYYERDGEWIFWTPIWEILNDPMNIRLRGKGKTLLLKDLIPTMKQSTVTEKQKRNDVAQPPAHSVSSVEENIEIEKMSKLLNVKESASLADGIEISSSPLTIRGFKGGGSPQTNVSESEE